ncbi:4-alpha-glucanotransferase [Desulfovibrio sp. OttesenSCG-928-G15]|nr:4-alpha-glucanotransferase [Desulfovibrio sp. OttesenSCG-928-G15]
MRRYGLLLHISSLPSAWGIGDMGPAAHDFARLLAEAGATLWQFLPLNPTSTFIGNSPYSSPSAFAGNPLFISPDLLLRDGYISRMNLDDSFLLVPGGSFSGDSKRVNFEAVTAQREFLLARAFEGAMQGLSGHEAFCRFCEEHAHWLHDYARFVSLKLAHGGASWVNWPRDIALREPEALARWDEYAATAILKEKFIQYLFYSQWLELRRLCNSLDISLLADAPIYVTHDSADVWANPRYYHLDEDMQPYVVSGVPPDYFSETGQRWGTPLYRWEVMQADGFSWWKKRLGHALLLADMVRLDHFRGFCGYWEIPADEETAVNGAWRYAPGKELFYALREHFGSLPFLAEDLGVITDDVRETMREFSLPGMHVLQFAFGGDAPSTNPDIPHAIGKRSFVYTGTHDNAPTRAWFESATRQERGNLERYAGMRLHAESSVQALTRLAFAAQAEYAVIPAQDALLLGAEDRMNVPGVAQGNWGWRMQAAQAAAPRFEWVKEMAWTFGRLKEGTIYTPTTGGE